MLKDILRASNLDAGFCANLLGVTGRDFRGWLEGKRTIPRFAVKELAAVLGVPPEELVSPASSQNVVPPAIWFKLRDPRLTPADRELVCAVRKVGYFTAQLDRVTESASDRYRLLFEKVRAGVDKTAPPSVQAEAAAQVIRTEEGFNNEQRGIGEFLRPFLRRSGLLLVESSLPPGSRVEGCTFRTGSGSDDRVCLFANSYGTTWFRRNSILLHELAHAIFDLDEQVALDYKNEGHGEWTELNDVSEARAQLFAQQMLVPCSVLIQITNRYGINWDAITPRPLAQLVASSHAEAKLVLKAAQDCGLITAELRDRYEQIQHGGELRELSDHALTTPEYIQRFSERPAWAVEKRSARVGSLRLILPLNYVSQVVESVRKGQISIGKASQMLFIDEQVFITRFNEDIGEVAA